MPPGTFDKELALSAIVTKVRSKQLKFAKTLEEKYRKSAKNPSSPETNINSLLQSGADTPGSESSDDSRGVIKRRQENTLKCLYFANWLIA